MNNYPEIDTLSRLLDLAGRYGVEELEVEEGGLRIRLEAGVSVAPAADEEGAVLPRILWSPPPMGSEPAGSTRPETAQVLPAPLTGTFYRAESPESPNFVEVGDVVEAGQTIGLIEAMKVFSPIQTEVAGTVVEIVAQNGRLVLHGDAILYIDPAG